jgi:hypothetical protein
VWCGHRPGVVLFYHVEPDVEFIARVSHAHGCQETAEHGLERVFHGGVTKGLT